MPRTRRPLEWSNRVGLFLAYRTAKRKVYPVAQHFGVARSTVRSVVNEFIAAGFSDGPRVNLGRGFLARAQALHLDEVIALRDEERSSRIPPAAENGRGGLDPGEALGEDPHSQAAYFGSLDGEESLDWHVRETEAEAMVRDANAAVRAYDDECLGLWLDIRQELEVLTTKKLKPDGRIMPSTGNPRATLGITSSLIDVLYAALFAGADALAGRDAEDVLHWGRDSRDPQVLVCNAITVARGDHSTLDAVQRTVTEWFEDRGGSLAARARRLEQLHHDLGLLRRVVANALIGVEEAALRSNICPLCPYPEAMLEEEAGGDSD